MTPMMPTISPREFVGRWRDAGFGERQGAQSFFNDLCGLVGHATPAAHGDPEAFTFEKAVPGGFADAYYEEHFGWEFKGQDAQLDGAFDQLLRYQVHLKTPPLLIVSSFQTVRIQTNFPGMETARYDVRHRGVRGAGAVGTAAGRVLRAGPVPGAAALGGRGDAGDGGGVPVHRGGHGGAE